MTKKATIELQFDPMDYTGMLTLTNDLYAFKAYRVDRGRFCNYKNELSFSGVYILDAGFSEGVNDKGDDTTHDELSNSERSQINDGQVARRQIYILGSHPMYLIDFGLTTTNLRKKWNGQRRFVS